MMDLLHLQHEVVLKENLSLILLPRIKSRLADPPNNSKWVSRSRFVARINIITEFLTSANVKDPQLDAEGDDNFSHLCYRLLFRINFISSNYFDKFRSEKKSKAERTKGNLSPRLVQNPSIFITKATIMMIIAKCSTPRRI
jgi:hypothetical protein